MNRDEYRYRWTGQALIILLGLWVTAMLLALVLPAALWKNAAASIVVFGGIFPILFLTAMVLGIMRMVAYIRWTGKYPYYFLFGSSGGSGRPRDRRESETRSGEDDLH